MRRNRLARLIRIICRRLVFRRQVRWQIHAVVQDAANFDLSLSRCAVNEEMTRAAHTADWSFDVIATVEEVVGPGAGDDLFPCGAVGALGIIGDVNKGLHKQCFVS